MNGPTANRTRVSSVQAKYSATRLWARFVYRHKVFAPTTNIMKLMINSNRLIIFKVKSYKVTVNIFDL